MRVSSRYLLLLVLPIIGGAEFRSDYQFSKQLDGWFRYQPIPARWHAAKLRCKLEGAELASPTSQKVLETMKDTINNQNPPRAVYTGVHATFSKGYYYTVSGVPLSKLVITWAPNEPDNRDNNEDCIIMHPNGTMADVNCDGLFPYICYKERTEDMPPMSVCGTIDPEYRFDNRTGSCYKYHRLVRTWARAFATCAAEGGHLAIINSPNEAQILKELHENSSSQTRAKKHQSVVYLGFRFMEEWLTIHGQPLEEAGYAKWARKEPKVIKKQKRKHNGEYCGAMDMECEEIGLKDLWCGESNPFICEMTPRSEEATAIETASSTQPPLVNLDEK